jgi:membrane-associated phospholipid phosphatase
MEKKIMILLMTFAVNYPSVYAQVNPDTTSDRCAICENHTHIITHPYINKLKQEIPFIIASGLTFGGGFVIAGANKTKNYTADELVKNPPDKNSINSFDRKSVMNWSPSIGKTSDYVLFGITALPVLFLSEHHTEKDIKSLAIMYLEVFTINYGITDITKNLTNRARPFVYNTDLDMSTRTSSISRQSFFSGHTSQTAAATFFFAKVISDYHPNLKPGLKTGIWFFAAAVPAVNGYLRVKAGDHFPTDVIAGYVVGAATGWLIPHLHQRKKFKDKNNVDVGFIPYKDGMLMNLNIRL